MSGLPGTPGLALKVGVAVAGAVYVYWRWTQARERAAKDEWLVLPSFEAKREASSLKALPSASPEPSRCIVWRAASSRGWPEAWPFKHDCIPERETIARLV
jgi:hypothetical protein|tara:strand:+ start:96 stop:398 length:303 start_codon:yes stop_codon:yes gene_type:complete